MGDYDAAMGAPRDPRISPRLQEIYEFHYARTLWLLKQGVTPRQILHFDPSADRPLEDYLKVPR